MNKMNAIILAAGMGTRLRPYTDQLPKPLVQVNGEPIIERQIKFLREKNITDITIVTGYLSQKLDYLKEKYGVALIYNEKYDTFNNAYSMYLVKDLIANTYVLEGDVFLIRNVFKEKLDTSCYFGGIKYGFSGEWMLQTNPEGYVEDISVGNGDGYIMSGVSYWNKQDGQTIQTLLSQMNERADFRTIFWDDMIKENLNQFAIKLEQIKTDDWFEIDSVEDLEKVSVYTA